MAANLDPLKRALLRPSRELLFLLHEEAKRARDSGRADFAAALPLIRIDTVWRLSYEGRVLEAEVQGGIFRVLFAPNTPAGMAPALTYLELVEPFQITVFEAPRYARLFRFGEASRWSTDAPPGALELRRHLQRVREELSGAGLSLVVEDTLTTDRGSGNAVVRDVVQAVAAFVAEARRDEVGTEALKALRTLRLAFRAGVSASPTRSPEGIEILFDPAEGLGERSAFDAQLNALL